MISPLIKKLVALSILGILVLLVMAVVVLPYLNWTDQKRASIEALQLNLARYENIAQKATQYEVALENIDPGQVDALLFRAGTLSLARAGLQDEFSKIARTVNIEGSTFRPLNAEPENNLARIGFRVSFRAPVFDFLELLKGLYADRKLYLVQNLKIKAPDEQEGLEQPVLNIQMDVWGFTETPDA